MMPRVLGIAFLTALVAASLACGTKKPLRTEPTLPAPRLSPVLAAHPIEGLAPLEWPPAPMPAPVADLLADVRDAPLPRAATERERLTEPPPPPSPPVAEPLRLSTADAPDEIAATRLVREKLERARRALRALRYDSLTSDGRAQYDTVVELIQQAEEALKARNLVFALKVADKAETLARRLGDRDPVVAATR